MFPNRASKASGWRSTVRRVRAAAVVNVYRGLCLFLLGASPVLVKVALATPMRAAICVGAVLALWQNGPKLRAVASNLIPEAASEALEADLAHFSSLTAKGPIFRALVRQIKRFLDCQRTPLAPAGLHATGIKSTCAKLSWEPTVVSSLSDESYRLELAPVDVDASEPAESAWQCLYDGPLCAKDATGLAVNTPFYWRVRAHNNKGESSLKAARFVTLQEPSKGKGGVARAYSWSQDEREVLVRAAVPRGVKAADLAIACTALTLRVALVKKGPDQADVALLAGTLHKAVDPSEFAWQFAEPLEGDEREAAAKEAGLRILELTLPKADKGLGRPMWPALISGFGQQLANGRWLHLEHPRIDVSLIKQEVPELGEHHLKELHEMTKGGSYPPKYDEDDGE